MIPLFDSLAHPTLAGTWGERKLSADFPGLDSALRDAGFLGACAVGIAGREGYEHEAFRAACDPFPRLLPIAGCDPTATSDPDAEVRRLQRLGFRGLKIHPRFSRLDLADPRLAAWLQAAGEADLPVFLCTYFFTEAGRMQPRDPFYDLVVLLQKCPRTRLVLVHGGGVEVLKYSELVRFNANLLLDLSLTMMKYPGSSVDRDLEFLFRHFDRRICVGSDHPEYSHRELRRRFEHFTADLEPEKAENVASKNILKFLGVEHEFAKNSL